MWCVPAGARAKSVETRGAEPKLRRPPTRSKASDGVASNQPRTSCGPRVDAAAGVTVPGPAMAPADNRQQKNRQSTENTLTERRRGSGSDGHGRLGKKVKKTFNSEDWKGRIQSLGILMENCDGSRVESQREDACSSLVEPAVIAPVTG
jgi:hypothetical protein